MPTTVQGLLTWVGVMLLVISLGVFFDDKREHDFGPFKIPSGLRKFFIASLILAIGALSVAATLYYSKAKDEDIIRRQPEGSHVAEGWDELGDPVDDSDSKN